MDELKQFKEQHINSYKNAIIECIKNNTCALFEEDIASLIKKPPLDSMDLIKNKLLSLAKKNKIVLKTMELDCILDNYRDNIVITFNDFEEKRIIKLTNIVNKCNLDKEEIIKINKKEFNDINKEMKKKLKETIIFSYNNTILKKINDIFDDNTSDSIRNSIIGELNRYINKTYIKQISESIDFKLLVKDTTLINNIKEFGERYLFTINNSRLLNK